MKSWQTAAEATVCREYLHLCAARFLGSFLGRRVDQKAELESGKLYAHYIQFPQKRCEESCFLLHRHAPSVVSLICNRIRAESTPYEF